MLSGNAARALILVYILWMSSFVNCFKCYQCRSDTTKLCDAKVSTSYLKECTAENKGEKPSTNSTSSTTSSTTSLPKSPEDNKEAGRRKRESNETTIFYCRKISQMILMRKSSEPVIIRECTISYNGDDCSQITNKLVGISICDCKKEACNRGISHEGALVWTTVLSFITIVIKLFL